MSLFTEPSAPESTSSPGSLGAGQLEPGDTIQIFGLTCSPELNGSTGVCERWDPEFQRWQVQLDVALWGCGLKSIEARNLSRMAAASGDAPSPKQVSEPSSAQRDGETEAKIERFAKTRSGSSCGLEAVDKTRSKRFRKAKESTVAAQIELPKPTKPPMVLGPSKVLQAEADVSKEANVCKSIATPPKTHARKRGEVHDVQNARVDSYDPMDVSQAMRKLVEEKIIPELPHHLRSGPKVKVASGKGSCPEHRNLAEMILQKFMDPKIAGPSHELTTDTVIKLFPSVKTPTEATVFKDFTKESMLPLEIFGTRGAWSVEASG